MDAPLARRYTAQDPSAVDRSSEHLTKLLKRIEKKKTLKGRNRQTNEADSGVDCNAESDVIERDALNGEVTSRVSIIGGHDFDRNKEAVTVLPKWLAEPVVISTDLTNLTVKVKKFHILDQLLIERLKENGVKFLFPVQAEVIPWLLRKHCGDVRRVAPRDVCVSAPTGSGKTLAYVLPIVQSLKTRFVPKIRALIVVPVQELALQVADVFRKYAKGTKLRIEVTTGGKTELSVEQLRLVRKIGCLGDAYESKVDILITTPGRLVEHLKYTQGFDLSNLKYLVIDEADRVMENVQDDWMHILSKRVDRAKTSNIVSVRTVAKRREPQKLLFSATLSHDPEKLKELGLFQPILFTSVAGETVGSSVPAGNYVGKYTTPRELEEFYARVPLKLKPLVVWALVNRGWSKVLCFAKSVQDAHRLSTLLGLLLKGKTVKELSSKLSRQSRDDTLCEFARGDVDLLFCSDVMARGVDIPGVEYVVSYDPPKHAEGYVHRVGRTGRAGAKGTALTLLDPETQETAFLQKLLSAGKSDLRTMTVDESEYIHKLPEYKRALASLKSTIDVESDVQKLHLKRKKGSNNKSKHKKIKAKS